MMSWTGFVAQMKDGKQFAFGTAFSFSFFNLPEGYTFSDIDKIINHSYLNNNGELKKHTICFMEWPEDYDNSKIFAARPFFECFIDSVV